MCCSWLLMVDWILLESRGAGASCLRDLSFFLSLTDRLCGGDLGVSSDR